jgi:hypothetical protein
MRLKKFLLIFILGGIFMSFKALAVCPVCVVTVAGGIELSRLLKIDDLITGLWIGGLIVSLIYWTIDVLNKKSINFKAKNLIVILGWCLITYFSLYFSNIKSTAISGFLGFLDKLSLGTIIGSVAFWFGVEFHNHLKEKNNGKVYFPFQKVVVPVGVILILSLIFYFIIK